jgi:hypothetical protein
MNVYATQREIDNARDDVAYAELAVADARHRLDLIVLATRHRERQVTREREFAALGQKTWRTMR